MKLTNEEYAVWVREVSPRSPLGRDLPGAFLIGGGICTVGQLVLNGLQALGLEGEAAATGTTVVMIFLGALLTAFSVYDDLAKYAGAGTLVPVTGFSNAMVSPAMEFRTEGIVTGVCARMFTIAGPVIVAGTVASVVYGVIYWLAAG